MAIFTIKDYITIGSITGVTEVEWQVATDIDFKNIIATKIVDDGDLFTCRIPLQKPDGTWYEEDDEIYVRVKLHDNNSESPWYLVDQDKSSLVALWINDNLKDNINEITKHRVGVIERDKDGDIVTDFIDEVSLSDELKKFRHEEYRKDY